MGLEFVGIGLAKRGRVLCLYTVRKVIDRWDGRGG
jgi:hypothetical protein